MCASWGVCYVAIGAAAEREARLSQESLAQVGRYEVAVLGEPIEGLTNAQAARWYKTNLDRLSPFDETLYLDADSRPHGGALAGLMTLADRWDMAICPSMQQGADWLWHVSSEERDATRAEIGELLQLQAGVFFFRKNERTARFFAAWRNEWLRWKGEDQGAFLRALVAAPVRVWLLGHPWNGGAVIGHKFGACRKAQ